MRKFIIILIIIQFVTLKANQHPSDTLKCVTNEIINIPPEFGILADNIRMISNRATLVKLDSSMSEVKNLEVVTYPSGLKFGQYYRRPNGGDGFTASFCYVKDLILNEPGLYKLNLNVSTQKYNYGGEFINSSEGSELYLDVSYPELIVPLNALGIVFMGENLKLNFATYEFIDADEYSHEIFLNDERIDSLGGAIVDLTPYLQEKDNFNKILKVVAKYRGKEYSFNNPGIGIGKSTWEAQIVRPVITTFSGWSQNEDYPKMQAEAPSLQFIFIFYQFPAAHNQYDNMKRPQFTNLEIVYSEKNIVSMGDYIEDETGFGVIPIEINSQAINFTRGTKERFTLRYETTFGNTGELNYSCTLLR